MGKGSWVSILFYIVSLLPFWLLYIVSDILYFLLYKVVRYRVKVVRENLKNAFPEKSNAELRKIEKDFYSYLPDLMVEIIKMKSISVSEVNKRFKILNPEELQKHVDQGKSPIVVTSHYGNWEMAIHGVCLQFTFPALIIYKPLSNQTFDDAFSAIRERFGAVMVPMKKTLRYVLNYRDTPHVSIYVSDQSPTPAESNFHMPFLNQPTFVYTGPEKMASKLQSPVVFCEIIHVKRGYYEAHLTTIADNPKDFEEFEITRLHNRLAEEIIQKNPAFWLWSHKRWKRKPKTNENEFYVK